MSSGNKPPPQYSEVDYDPFAGAQLERVVRSTESQRELWLADALGFEASLAFNESVLLTLSGRLHRDALCGAIRELANRHEALRTTFSANGEEMLIASESAIELTIEDISTLAEPDQALSIEAAKYWAVETRFDLVKGPLFRTKLVSLSRDRHLLILAAHHIVCDGWSFGVIVRELGNIYAALCGMHSAPLPEAASFADFARAWDTKERVKQQRADEAYWLGLFAGGTPVLDLPLDCPRSPRRTFASRREDFEISANLVAELRKTSARAGANLFSALIAGFAAVLARISGAEEDIVIGIPAAGQATDGLGTLVGHCVNLLPLRVSSTVVETAAASMSAVQSRLLDAYEHQQYTFGTLLKSLAVERDPSRLPLVSVMFNIDQAFDSIDGAWPGLNVDVTSIPRKYENFELFVNAVQLSGGLRLECQYNVGLFDAPTIRRWLHCYRTVLESMAARPTLPLRQIDLISEDDRRLLQSWNATQRAFPQDALVHELYEAQVHRTPFRTAIQFQGEFITYDSLDRQANRLAHLLRDKGVRRGQLVGIHLTRTPAMVVSILAVLKAGAGYVPLDPYYPAERIRFMADDAGLTALISASELANNLKWDRSRTIWVDVDAGLIAGQSDAKLNKDSQAATPNDPAYVIYTSGSTGKPKGVVVPHRAVANFLQSMAAEPGISDNDKLVAVTTLSFDIAVNELLLPLTAGAEIVLASREQAADGVALCKLIMDSGATMLQATPATWHMLIEAGWNGAAGFTALCGGEALNPELAAQLLPRTGALWNMYGPTETTVWSTCSRVVAPGGISIGRPIANTAVHILGEGFLPLPIGSPGEICIGGAGVTLGYLNRPELTADRFVPDVQDNTGSKRLYRTGDRGRWRNDGSLEHLGRLDFQVKVRGYRIELGEIEACCQLHPTVLQSVAIAREDRPGDVRLVAYVVSRPGTSFDEAVLRAHLKTLLPAYMLPSYILHLDGIPLLPNGKIDRKALPLPSASSSNQAIFVEPASETEKEIAAEMETCLGLPGIGVHDNFFALGGHSLLAAQLVARLNQRLGVQLSMHSIFDSPTIASLAASIQNSAPASPDAVTPKIAACPDQFRAPLTSMQEWLWFVEELYPGQVAYNVPSAHRLKGQLNETAMARAFAEIISRQPALRTQFERIEGELVQRVLPKVECSVFPAEDLSHLPPAEREMALISRLDKLTAETFDLKCAPLFKVQMFRLAPEEHVLFFMAHHIVWDGWSFDLLYEELSQLYDAFCAGATNPLTPLAVTYVDYAAWQRAWLLSNEFHSKREFWRRKLAASPPVKSLETDFPRRQGHPGGGSTEWIDIGQPTLQSLHRLAQSVEATVSMTVLAAYVVMLHVQSGMSDIAVGIPVRGRDRPELEKIMGYFSNVLPLNFTIEPEITFSALVRQVKAAQIGAFVHPDMPREELVKLLTAVRKDAKAPLYQALFSFQDARQRTHRWGGLQHSMVPVFQRGVTDDLGVWFLETDDGLQGGITYNTDVFAHATAIRLKSDLLAILDIAVSDPSTSLGELGRIRQQTDTAVSERPLVADPSINSRPTNKVALSETELLLAEIWRSELKISRVESTDNFLDLGGHSLLAMQVMAQMEARTGKRINPQKFIFETLAQIARAYEDAEVVPQEKPGAVRRLFSRILGSNDGQRG